MTTHDTFSSDLWTTPPVIGPPVRAPFRPRPVRSPARPDLRVLFISYAFPPTGGGGVQRAAKFAKYLPQFGWQPTVLTVANPSVPVRDHDLAEDIDPALTIVRAKTWEPGYGVKKQLAHDGHHSRLTLRGLLRRVGMQVLQPDPQILWNPSAFRAAVRAIQTQAHQAILVTGPPFSSFLLGVRLKRRFGVPLVLDFRDEWMLVARHLENYQLSGLAYRWQQAMLRRVLRAADAVIATTRASADELARCCRDAGSAAAVHCIYNGFDPDDVRALECDATAPSTMRIVYTGTLWKLTDITPLVQALQCLAHVAPDRTADVELVIVGRRTAQQDAVLDQLKDTAVSVVRHDYLSHRQSLQLAGSADLLLLLLADQPGAERVVPAKLFEYLALGKPILAVGPEGETCELLRRHSRAAIFRPAEPERLARWLQTQLETVAAWRMPCGIQHCTTASSTLLARFSRPSLAGELAHLLGRCVTADP